jgi:site-specific recombinase XerD
VTKRQKVKSSVETTDSRARDFLDSSEVTRLLEAAKRGRHGARDYSMLLIAFRHGLRVSELVGMRRDAVRFNRGRLWVERAKGSISNEQWLEGDEIRALKRYLATRKDSLPWLFVSERGTQLTRQQVNYVVAKASERAKLGHVWPHMLRHSCGFAQAERGTDLRVIQELLGHTDPKHTSRYTRLAGTALRGLWK